MNNKSVFNVIIKNNFDEVAGKIDYLIQELNTVEKIRLDLSALNLNSLYLNNHDYAWNIFKGITPQHSIQDDDFLYQQGDIDIQQLLEGQQNLIQQINSSAKNFERRFLQIAKQAVDYNQKALAPIINRNLIDENLAGKNEFSEAGNEQLQQLMVIYANVINKLNNNNNTNPDQYKKLEMLAQDISNAIHQFDNVSDAQQLGMTFPIEAFWRIAAAQGAYHGENIDKAKEGEMGLSYQQLVEAADELEKQIKQLPATDIKEIARQAQNLDQINQRIAFLGAALNLKNEPFHRQTMINQAQKLAQQAAQQQVAPEPVDKLNSIEKLQEALNFYKKQLLNADKEDIQSIAAIITQIQNKQNAIKDMADINSIQNITDSIQKNKGYKLKISVDKIGLQNIQNYILKLQNILQNAGDAISKKQRKQIQSLITQWQKYSKVAKASAISFKKTWGAIEQVGDGIENISNLCKGGASDWQIFTGIVDSAIQIFEGFQTVIQILQTLGVVMGQYADEFHPGINLLVGKFAMDITECEDLHFLALQRRVRLTAGEGSKTVRDLGDMRDGLPFEHRACCLVGAEHETALLVDDKNASVY